MHQETFPRWGYLDKFAVNEYMARALLVAIALGFACLGAANLWSAGQRPGAAIQVPVPRPGTRTYDVWVNPPPSIMSLRHAAIVPRVEPARRVTGKLVPVVDPISERHPPNDFAAGAGGSGSGPDAAASVEGEEVAPGIVDPTPLPRFDEIVVVEKEPDLVSISEPRYPEIAREAGIEGLVLVRVLVGADGLVKDQVVIESVLGLDEVAATAARTAVFKPALQQGHAVAVWVVIPIVFKLHGRDAR